MAIGGKGVGEAGQFRLNELVTTWIIEALDYGQYRHTTNGGVCIAIVRGAIITHTGPVNTFLDLVVHVPTSFGSPDCAVAMGASNAAPTARDEATDNFIREQDALPGSRCAVGERKWWLMVITFDSGTLQGSSWRVR